MATKEGSFITMPSPRTYTSVLAVPRSMARSLENSPARRLISIPSHPVAAVHDRRLGHRLLEDLEGLAEERPIERSGEPSHITAGVRDAGYKPELIGVVAAQHDNRDPRLLRLAGERRDEEGE